MPDGWSWCRLSLLGEYKKGPFGSALTKSMFVPKSESTIKVYEQKNAIYKNSSLGDYYISKKYFETKMKSFEAFPGDIIVSCAGTIGETYILPKNIERGIINQALMRMKITDKINIGYFLMFFDHILKDEAAKSGKGTAIKNIPPFDVFKQFLLPLPPLNEQQLIVAEIEKIFAQIDLLEQNKTDLQTAIKQTKSKILDLAIHGKLVPQDPNDEPTEELLKRIATSDNRPYKKFEEAVLFEIPKSWSWCYLHTISALLNGDRGENYPSKKDYVECGIPFINAGCLDNGNINYDVANYITEEKYNSLRAGKIQKGDILYCLRGSLGKTGFVITDNKGAIFPSLCIFRLNESVIPQYFLYVLNSNAIKVQQKMVDNGTAQPNLSAKDVSNYQIPLPPLAEQYRIVTKIEELFEKLDIISN